MHPNAATHSLAFNTESVALHLRWLTLRYGVDVRLEIAPLVLSRAGA